MSPRVRLWLWLGLPMVPATMALSMFAWLARGDKAIGFPAPIVISIGGAIALTAITVSARRFLVHVATVPSGRFVQLLILNVVGTLGAMAAVITLALADSPVREPGVGHLIWGMGGLVVALTAALLVRALTARNV